MEHRQGLAGVLVQVFRLCWKAGLVRLGHVSFDGSKVAANASKHRAMSYARMQEEEKKIEEDSFQVRSPEKSKGDIQNEDTPAPHPPCAMEMRYS